MMLRAVRLVDRALELMDCSLDARSITYTGIKEIVKLMAPDDSTKPFTSEEMRKIFTGEEPFNGQAEKFHPMERFEQFYSMRPPDFAVTYVWGVDFRKDLPLYLESVKQYVRSEMFVQSGIERSFDEMTFWIDIFFVDQNSSALITKLVEDCSHIYSRAPHHIMFMSGNILDRGWCLVEICYRVFAVQSEYAIPMANLTDLLSGSVRSYSMAHSSNISLKQHETETFISNNKLPSLHFIGDIKDGVKPYTEIKKNILQEMHVFNDAELNLIKDIITTLFRDEATFNRVIRAFARGAVAKLKKIYPNT
jgi:hypothetical protein